MQLTEYIDHLAIAWTEATGRSPGALGALVVNDGKFMGRIRTGTKPTTETFEKFLAFFRAGENWPDNRIPLAAAELLDRLENIAVGDACDMPSPTVDGSGGATGQAGDVSPELGEAA